MATLIGSGIYIPVFRIKRQSIAEQYGQSARGGETAVPAHDEDVLTMAVSAAKEALANAGIEGSSTDAVYVASTSDPFDERGLAPHVALAIGGDESVAVADFSGSSRAGTNALFAARDGIDAGRFERAVVVGTDLLAADPGTDEERTAGAGAGAVVLDERGDVATISDAATNTTGFIGQFSRTGESPVPGDQRFNRKHGYLDSVIGAIKKLPETDPDRCILPSYGDWGGRALRSAGIDAERDSTFDDLGYAGAASTFLDLALAFENATPGESVLLASYGAGGSDAFLFETGQGVEESRGVRDHIESKKYVPYGKHRAYRKQARGGD